MNFIKYELKKVKKAFENDSLISRILLILSTPIFLFLYGLPGVLLTIWFWDADQSNYAGLIIKIPLNFLLIISIIVFVFFISRRYNEYSDYDYDIKEISEIEKNKLKNKDWRVDIFRIRMSQYNYTKHSLWTFYVSFFVFCTWFVYFVWQAVFD